jgi:uncharacterized membrane protein YgcG
MWSVIRWLVLRLAALRWLYKLGGLAFLLPLALFLKTIGLPLLIILAVLAIPVLILLLLFGLPIFLVMIFGSMVVGVLGFVLTIGLAAVKIGLLVVLPLWLMWMIGSKAYAWSCKRRGGGDSGGDSGGDPRGHASGGGGDTGPTSTPSDAGTGPSGASAADGFDAA